MARIGILMVQANTQSSSDTHTPLGVIETDYEERARTIIHSYATAASIWEGKVSRIPFVGNFGVMFGSDLQPVSLITAAMIKDLGNMFERRYAKEIVFATSTHFIGTFMGIALARSMVSFVPFVGHVVNAGMVLHVTEAMGWASYLMYRDKAAVKTNMDDDEKGFKPYILRGLGRAEREMGLRKRVMERLTPDQRAEHDELIKKLYKNLAGNTRRSIIDDIEKIIGSWSAEPAEPVVS